MRKMAEKCHHLVFLPPFPLKWILFCCAQRHAMKIFEVVEGG